ncbi:corticospinal neuron axon guidance through spinal cord [Branchiostoma belcheri]|nr:corticospinal neuron axon guidance through spinal cord [Branchiostoma belcheri]
MADHIIRTDKPTSTPSVHLPVLIRSVCGSVAGIGLIGVTILAIRYWKGKGSCPLEQNAGIVGGNKNTTATALSSAHGQTGQSQANIHSVQNVFYEAPAVLTSNQFQAITESNTPANVVSSGDDHQYEDIDNHHDNRNLFNAKGLTPSAANSGHTTATVSASSHNQSRQGQSQAIKEYLDARNISYGTGQTASNVNAGYTTATISASSQNQSRQEQSQAINEPLDARNLSYGTGQTASNVNSGYTTADVMVSGPD